MRTKPALLLYLAANDDPQRVAVAPALAGLAARNGVSFECYYSRLALGRHFGGGPVTAADLPRAGGSPLAGGRHADEVRRLGDRYAIVGTGDPTSPVRGVVEECGTWLDHPDDPAGLYAAVAARFSWELPARAYVVDASPQGPEQVVTAPYVAPHFLSGSPVLGVEAGAGEETFAALAALGIATFACRWVDPERRAGLPVPIEDDEGMVGESGYAAVTAAIAAGLAGWGDGVVIGDPDLVAAQVARIAARRLVPLYGQPTRAVLSAAPDLVARTGVTVIGRQYDDTDFFDLAAAGKALQVVDPGPPFESATVAAPPLASADDGEPTDPQLAAWAADGAVLTSLCLWAGMIREIDGIPRLADLVLDTGLRAGLVLTAETAADPAVVTLISAPPAHGGIRGRLEPMLGSTGWGVAAEQLLPPGVLAAQLTEARQRLSSWPADVRPRGWWPLLDAPLRRDPRPPVAVRDGLPRLLFTPRSEIDAAADQAAAGEGAGELDARRVVGGLLRRTGAIALTRPRRPFDGFRPGALDPRVAAEVAASGLSYMFTKSTFGAPRVAWRTDEFVALPFTAGRWDGWSPFYTVGGVADVRAAERRLTRRRRPGWLVSTVDTPLFALAGEVWEHGARLRALAAFVADGGRSGRLINVMPQVVARYARLLADGAGR